MANNTLIGALRAEATLESGKFVDGAKKIRTETKKTEAQLKTSFGNMGKAVSGFGTALTAGLSIGLLSATIKKSLDYASSLKTISQQAGVTTRDLQTLRYAATQNGLTVAQFDDGLTKLKETMGKVAAGATAPTKAFDAIGISAKQLATLDPAQTFKLVADKLAAIPDPAKRAAIELALFGEAGSKLDPLLRKGGGAINELAKAAQELGIVLSDRQIQSADETAAKLDQVKMVLAAQISGVVADNAASIVTLSNALGQLTGAIINFLGSNPMAAIGILGALAGGRLGGLPGAAIGGFAGLVAGAGYSSEQQYQGVRRQGGALLRHNFIQSVDRARALRKSGDTRGANAEYARARRLRDKYLASGGTIPGYNPNAIPNIAIPQFMALAGAKPRKGGGGRKGPRDRSEDATFQVEQEIRRADMDILRAKQALAHNHAESAALALQMLDLERAQFDAEQEHRVAKAKQDFAEGRITQAALDEVVASSATLKAKYDIKDKLERQAILEDEEIKRLADRNALGDKDFEIQRDIMQKRAQLAETAAERRALELELLRLEYEHRRMVLERIVAESKDEQEIALARRDLAALGANYDLDRQGVMNSTRGPWDEYLASLPTTAAKADEALQRLQVQGFEGLIDAAMELEHGFDDAGKALLATVKNFLLGVLRMQLQAELGSLFKPGGGSPLGGLLGGAGSLFGSIGGSASSGIGAATGSFDWATPGMASIDVGNIPMFASGGGFNILGRHGVDKNLLQLNGIPIARVSYGERLSVSNDDTPVRGAAGARGTINFNFPNSDFNSFKRSQTQAARAARRTIGRG